MDGTDRRVGGTGRATVRARAGNGTPSDALTPLASLANNAVNLSLRIRQLKARVGVVRVVGTGMPVPFGLPTWRPFLESQAPEAMVGQRVVDLSDHFQYKEAAEALTSDPC